jgi:hypothetical protein
LSSIKKTTRNQEFIHGTTRKKGGQPSNFAANSKKYHHPYAFTLTEWKIEKNDSR